MSRENYKWEQKTVFKSAHQLDMMMQCKPVILELKMWRQEDHESKATLD